MISLVWCDWPWGSTTVSWWPYDRITKILFSQWLNFSHFHSVNTYIFHLQSFNLTLLKKFHTLKLGFSRQQIYNILWIPFFPKLNPSHISLSLPHPANYSPQEKVFLICPDFPSTKLPHLFCNHAQVRQTLPQDCSIKCSINVKVHPFQTICTSGALYVFVLDSEVFLLWGWSLSFFVNHCCFLVTYLNPERAFHGKWYL